MRLIHFVIIILQEKQADVWKCWDSVLGHKDCRACNSEASTTKTVQWIARYD